MSIRVRLYVYVRARETRDDVRTKDFLLFPLGTFFVVVCSGHSDEREMNFPDDFLKVKIVGKT